MSRSSVRHSLPLSLLAALTTMVAFLAWIPFFERGGDFLMPLGVGVVALSVTGILARLARLPAFLVVSLQLLVLCLWANAEWGSSLAPTPTSLTALVRHLDASVTSLSQWAAPVPTAVEVALAIPLLGALLIHLLVDLTAVTLRRVPLAGLPLLAVQTVPISILDGEVHWLVFVATALCFLLLLCLQEGLRIGNWGRSFGAPRDADPFRFIHAVTPGKHPLLFSSTAVLCATLVAMAVPTFHLAPFDGRGGGGGDNEVSITNPIADLHRDLNRGADIPLLTVKAAGILPTYLRISALTQYRGATWSPGDRDLPADNTAEGRVPDPPGLTPEIPRTEREVVVEAEETFSSLWLPTALNVSAVRANSDWRYDRRVMDFHSAEDDITTAGLAYDYVEITPEIEREMLVDAPPPQNNRARDLLALPEDLPPIVGDLARQVTRDAADPYEKAVSLQEWFRSPENFTYSLETEDGAVIGNDHQALERFLSEDGRVGYCEQFAAAMALMARAEGIPSRVSVGFLRPARVANSTYEFSSHDLHAWPELWFEGVGWVMFEPTPQDRATITPSYTRGATAPETDPAEPTQAPTNDQPSTQPSAQPTPEPEQPEPDVTSTPGAEGEEGALRTWVLATLGSAAVIAALVLLPGLLRRRRTRERLSTGDPEAVWLELRDVVIDLGYEWPDHRSPRETGHLLASRLSAVPPPPGLVRPMTGPLENPAATQAVERLVAALEERRYAPAGDAAFRGAGSQHAVDADAEQLRSDARCITAALGAGATQPARRRARWLPRSLFR